MYITSKTSYLKQRTIRAWGVRNARRKSKFDEEPEWYILYNVHECKENSRGLNGRETKNWINGQVNISEMTFNG